MRTGPSAPLISSLMTFDADGAFRSVPKGSVSLQSGPLAFLQFLGKELSSLAITSNRPLRNRRSLDRRCVVQFTAEKED